MRGNGKPRTVALAEEASLAARGLDPDARCGAKTKQGKGPPCRRPAGAGTDHMGIGACKLHGGSTPNAGKAAARTLAISMGAPIDISPHEALLTCVRIVAGEVSYCTARIQELATGEYVEHPTSFREESGEGDSGSFAKDVTIKGPPSMNIWIETRHDAMDRLARYAKIALDAGVEERRIQLAEDLGSMMVPMFKAIFDQLDLTPAQQRRAPDILRAELLTWEHAAIGGAVAA